MIAAHYRFPRGSTIVVPLDFSADDGELPGDVTVTAWLRFAAFKPGEVTSEMPKVAEFAVEERGANAGWFLTIDAARSSTLDPGFYLTDIRMVGDDLDTISDRLAIIEITLPVTGGA